MSKVTVTSLLLVLVLMAMAVMPVLAVPPDRMEVPYNPTYQVTDCGAFQVINEETSTLRLAFFYDKDGALVRVNQYWSGTDKLTNSVTGASISSDFHNHAVFDVSEDNVRQSGIYWHVTVPHQGPVFFEAGQYVGIGYDQPDADITFTGVSALDEDALCALLAG